MKYALWIGAAACLIAGYAGYQYELRQIPVREMEKAEQRIVGRIGGYNKMTHPPRPTAQSRTVVRPSPDQLYSACVYDLSGGAVTFKGSAPSDSYWSLSFFAHNSDNFFVVNDRQLTQKEFHYTLIREGDEAPAGVNEDTIIRSPSRTGIVLQRIFIDSDERADMLDAQRKTASCSAAAS